jgi:hypothetical protein
MHVIGHYDERMQFIALELVLTGAQGVGHYLGDFGLLQESRAGDGLVQQAVHDYE